MADKNNIFVCMDLPFLLEKIGNAFASFLACLSPRETEICRSFMEPSPDLRIQLLNGFVCQPFNQAIIDFIQSFIHDRLKA